jgi:glycyl-tRNA synthetase beta chain
MPVNSLQPQSLLIELLTEELPPKALKRLGQSFASVFAEHLIQEGLCNADATVTAFAAPRRLAVHIAPVRPQAADSLKREKLLPVSIALDANGQATAPLVKKLASLGAALGSGISLDSLERVHDGKQEVFYYQYQATGQTLAQAAQAALDSTLARLPIPKVMGYQRPDGSTVKFVRPAHRLLALFGNTVLPLTALGLSSDRLTNGHRFHTHAPISIAHADDYANTLQSQGKVIASFESRQSLIRHQIAAMSAKGDFSCSW